MTAVTASTKRNVGFLLGLGVLFIPFAHSSNAVASQAAVTSPAPAATAPAEPLQAYTSSQVATSYDESTVAADILFKGKRVQVTGQITDINTDYFGNPYLVMGGKNQYIGPRFKFDRSAMSDIASLKKGESVKVNCTGQGDVLRTPMFEDCAISK